MCGGQRDKYDTEYLLGTAFLSNQLKDKIRAGDNSVSPSPPPNSNMLADPNPRGALETAPCRVHALTRVPW